MVFSVLCQLARLLRAQTHHFCIFSQWQMKGVGELQFGMGLPNSLSGEKKEIQAGSVSWWKQKTFVTPSHLICFVFILHTNQPGDSSRGTKGSQCCHPAAATCAFPQPCTWCQSPVQCWCLELMAPASFHPPWVANPPSHLICYPSFSGWVCHCAGQGSMFKVESVETAMKNLYSQGILLEPF